MKKILSEPNLEVDTLLKEKLPEIAKRIANETIGFKENAFCNTRYEPTRSPELLLWALGLVCETWTLEILRQKTQDGHCHTHKTPCLEGSKFHRALFNEAKKNFQDVLTSVEKNALPTKSDIEGDTSAGRAPNEENKEIAP